MQGRTKAACCWTKGARLAGTGKCRARSRTATVVAFRIFLLSIWKSNRNVEASVACTTTAECESSLRPGSKCEEGECTNPFHRGGCLSNLMPGWTKARVCHSEDPPGAAEAGHCRPPDPGLDYMEVRIGSQNWESAIFASWILQILLSEVLGVPATIETFAPDANMDFYDVRNSFQYGKSNDFDALRLATKVGDCRAVKSTGDEDYRSCAHVIPEVWNIGLDTHRGTLKDDAYIEPPQALGAFGQNGFFIPRFTAEKDPTLTSYLGLRGESNRHKLARTFKRPTTWGDYCDLVSSDGCRTDDGVARRAPLDEMERDRMYVEGLYVGHFRATERNNCTKYPDNCTGHIADFPCDWASLVQPLTYHLEIALESNGDKGYTNGYSSSQLWEMWMAANATRSDLFMLWWMPEALHQSFLNSEAEFHKVSFPPPTYKCYENRIHSYVRCNTSDLQAQAGEPEGACDEAPQALQKLISAGLYRTTFDPTVPEGRRSPGYEAVRLFSIAEVQLGQIYDYWLQREVDKANYDPRDATCRWIAENFDFVSEFIPRTYPRVVQEGQNSVVLFYLSIIFGVSVVILVMFACYMTHRQRKSRIIRFAQIGFLRLLLAGLLLLSLGAVVNAIPPTNASCVTVIWLINLGYTFELVPLIVKVAALNRLLGASRQMRRIQLKRSSLFGSVIVLTAVAVIYLIIWTIVDRPKKGAEYTLTDTVLDDGATVVTVTSYCESKAEFWWYISVGWNVTLLICATVLAFQTRKLQYDFNESRTLAFMIYSHFVLVLIIVSTYIFGDNMADANLARLRSLIYSLDTMATILIYFFPKFFESEQNSLRNRLVSRASRAARAVVDRALHSRSRNSESPTVEPTSADTESTTTSPHGDAKKENSNVSDHHCVDHAAGSKDSAEEDGFDSYGCAVFDQVAHCQQKPSRRKSV